MLASLKRRAIAIIGSLLLLLNSKTWWVLSKVSDTDFLVNSVQKARPYLTLLLGIVKDWGWLAGVALLGWALLEGRRARSLPKAQDVAAAFVVGTDLDGRIDDAESELETITGQRNVVFSELQRLQAELFSAKALLEDTERQRDNIRGKLTADLTEMTRQRDLEIQGHKGSVYILQEELATERKKAALLLLEKFGRSRTLSVTVRFIDYADRDQADAIVAVFRRTTPWAAQPLMVDGSTIRPVGANRIECASGNPENAQEATAVLNHGALLGERVGHVEIIDSIDPNLVFTVFPRSSMPPSVN